MMNSAQVLNIHQSRPQSAPETVTQPRPEQVRPSNSGIFAGEAPAIESLIPEEREPDWSSFIQVSGQDNSEVLGFAPVAPEPEPEPPVQEMTEQEFVEFWSVDAWDYIQIISNFLRFKLEVATEEDEIEEAERAARKLYKIAKKHQRYLGWMISGQLQAGSDMMIVMAFFGGKGMAIFNEIRSKIKNRKANRGKPEQKSPVKPAKTEGKVIDGEAREVPIGEPGEVTEI